VLDIQSCQMLRTTPGRRQFTLAHETSHALFHGERYHVGWIGRNEAPSALRTCSRRVPRPPHALRLPSSELGLSKVLIQRWRFPSRYFRVSYAMLLLRLRAARLADQQDVDRMRESTPSLAERLGYEIAPDEWAQSRIRGASPASHGGSFDCFDVPTFEQRLTLGGAASMTGLSEMDLEEFSENREPTQEDRDDFESLAASF